MKILALDTSSKVAGVAILDDEKLLGEYYINHKRNHSQKLMPIIKGLLDDLEIDVQDIDYYAVSVGPGSFTGLRIGITTVKGMAYATNKKVVEVDTLDALAENIGYANDMICAMIDARNEQAYVAIYDNGKKVVEDNAITIQELVSKLKFLENKVVFVGDGALVHEKYLKDELGKNCVIANQKDILPKASSVAQIALKKIKNGEVLSCNELLPNYLRKSQAEREYEKKHKS